MAEQCMEPHTANQTLRQLQGTPVDKEHIWQLSELKWCPDDNLIHQKNEGWVFESNLIFINQ